MHDSHKLHRALNIVTFTSKHVAQHDHSTPHDRMSFTSCTSYKLGTKQLMLIVVVNIALCAAGF